MVSKSVLNGGDGCSIVMDEDDVLPATLISHKHLLKEDLFVLVCNPVHECVGCDGLLFRVAQQT
eukprot:scaffold2486_cov169-Ochromonas_danica.AAC.13